MIVVALLVSNGLTLFFSGFHDVLYSALKGAVPTSWMKHSPTSKHQAANAKLKKFKTRTKSITKRVSKRAARNATANLGGAFTEALPGIGIAVIVGLTAMDIKDACSDMKDMQELNSMLSIEENPQEIKRICGMKAPSKEEVKKYVRGKWDSSWTSIFKSIGL